MKQPINKELLYHYWSGQATPMQQQLVKHWLDEPAHQELYWQWLLDWEETHPQALPDTDQAWSRIEGRLNTVPSLADNQRSEQTLSRRRYWTLAAASLLLTLTVLGTLYWEKLLYTTYQTGLGQVRSYTLRDGTKVTLNSNTQLTTLRYDVGLGPRQVWLQGEAEFSVRHLPSHRRLVVITPEEVEVEVVGTEFVLLARPRLFRLGLHEGKVVLHQHQGKQEQKWVLKPGDIASVRNGQPLTQVSRQKTRQLAVWKNRLFIFNHHSLPQVLEMIHQQFGEKVYLTEDSPTNFQITGRFKAERADELLEIIGELTGHRLIKRGNTSYLIKQP